MLPERLGQGAYRTPATHHRNPLAAGRIPESLHHVVTQKVGEQNHQADASRQRCRTPLVTTIAAADMCRNADSKLIKHGRNIAETVGTHKKRVHLFDLQ